jgi:hypothetical protein
MGESLSMRDELRIYIIVREGVEWGGGGEVMLLLGKLM